MAFPTLANGGRPPALEPLESTRPEMQAGSVRASMTPMAPFTRGPSDFNVGREGLKTSGTIRNSNTLGATSNLSEADTIKVAVRVRPLFPSEKEKGATQVVGVTEDHSLIKLVIPGPAGSKMQRDFAFHACLGPEVSQADVLHMCGIPQLLDAALAGYNVTVFAYGQTGSGKTFTMSGREEVIGTDEYKGGDSNDGIMSRAVGYLYQALQERKDQTKFALSASYLEIYNEGIFDLLNLRAKNLPVKWDAAQGFYVPGLKNVPCGDMNAMMEVIRTAMKHRHVGSHELNIESSRSHSIMTVTCAATPLDPNAADFGTSSRAKLLMDSLGGCAMALMIATCSPSSLHVEETLSTLSYATRAKNIQNRPVIQYDPKEQQIAALRREIDLLRQENMYLREQIQFGGGSLQTPLRDSMNDTVMNVLEQLGPAGTESDANGTGPAPQWPQLVYSPASSHGVRPSSMQQQQQGAQQAAAQAILQCYQGQAGQAGQAGVSGGGAALGSGMGQQPLQPMLLRSKSPRLNAMQPPMSPRLAVSFAQAAANGSVSSNGGGSTWSMLEPRSSIAHSSGDLGPSGRGLVSASLESVGSISGAAIGGMVVAGSHGDPQNFNRRLKETQALLARFAEENNRLAKENDRLRTTRTVLGAEHADVLDEIEQLRSKLTGLESAVMTGSFSPADVKALLSGIKQVGPPPKTGLSSNLRTSFSANTTVASPLIGANSIVTTASTPAPLNQQQQQQQQQRQQQEDEEGTASASTVPVEPPLSRLPSDQLPAASTAEPISAPWQHQQQQQQHVLSPHPPPSLPGSAIPRRSPSGSGTASATKAPSPPPSQPALPSSAGGTHHKQDVANIMTIGSSHAAAMRTRQGSMGTAGGGASKANGSDGIIVADQSKLSLLLGLGGGGAGEGSPAVAHAMPQEYSQGMHALPHPPLQPQQGVYRVSAPGPAHSQPASSHGHYAGMQPAGFPSQPGGALGAHPGALLQHPGSAHGMLGAGYQGMMQPQALMVQGPPQLQMPSPAAMRPLPVKPGGDFLNPAKQAHEQALIRKMLNSGAL